MARVDSTTLLGLVGIAGTLLGTAIGARGATSAARVTSRGQAEVEEQRARRQAYAACSTALLARRDAAIALLDAFMLDDDFDLTVAQARMQDLDDQRAIVARAVGAVVVEGPYEVAVGAEASMNAVEELAGRLRDWVASVAGGRDRGELVQSQVGFGRGNQREAEQAIGGFAAACRKVLHPAEVERFPWRRRRRWWLRNG